MPVIAYKLSLENAEPLTFTVDTERLSTEENTISPPFWTTLSHHQCPNCPLAASVARHCPAAVDIEHIVDTFCHVDSHAEVQVDVQIGDR